MKTLLLAVLFLLMSVFPCMAGNTAEFFAAVRSGNSVKVKKMLAKDKALVFVADKNGMTPFLVAVKMKNLKMVSLLADCFSRLGDTAAPGGAMHIAVSNNDEAMVRLLVRLAAEEDPAFPKQLINMPRQKSNSALNDRNTPLHLAAQKCNFRIYNYLLQYGASPLMRNARGQTPKQIINACPKPQTKKKEAKPASSVPASKPKPVAEPLIFPIP